MKLKYMFLCLIMLSFISFSFGATQEITACPTNWISGDTYIIQEGFPSTQCIINNNSVTITSGGDYNQELYFYINSDLDDVVLENITANELLFAVNTGKHITNIELNNNIFDNQNSNFLSFEGASSINHLTLDNNVVYYQNTGVYDFWVVQNNIGTLTAGNVTIINNDIVGPRDIFHASTGKILHLDNDVYINNNILMFFDEMFFGTTMEVSASCNIDFTTNNFYTNRVEFIIEDDNDLNFEDDVLSTLTSNSCQYFNGRLLTQKAFNSDTNKIAINHFEGNPSYFTSNKQYYLGNDFTLNNSDYISFGSSTNIELNLLGNADLTLTNTNLIRTGIGNTIKAYDGNPNIQTTGVISATYNQSDYELGNYGLISYVSELTLEGIDFILSATGNYGLVKKITASGGQDLNIIDSSIDINFVPTTINTPLIVSGYSMNLQDNLFDFGTINDTQYTAFRGGFTNGIGGQHTIINNEFRNGGYLFTYINDGTNSNIPNLIIHNKFNKVGSYYTYPFDPASVSYQTALMDSPSLIGSYYYQTGCDSYEFNLGNYYQDLIDSGVLNDTDSDGIDNIGFVRGHDRNDEEIIDSRILMAYPYDFASNTGNAESLTDLCGDFSYNIVIPQNNITYPTGGIFTNFEFISSTYGSMAYCEEVLNNEKVIYTNINSGENKGSYWDTTDGVGTYQVTCCDTLECNNLVKISAERTFCVGDCIGQLSVLDINATAPSGGDGDSGDGGSSFTGDDDVFGNTIDLNDVDGTSEGVLTFLGDSVNFIIIIGIPIAIFIIIMILLLIIINLVRL